MAKCPARDTEHNYKTFKYHKDYVECRICGTVRKKTKEELKKSGECFDKETD